MPLLNDYKPIFTERFVYTNYLMATSSDPEAIIRLIGMLHREVHYHNIKRVLMFNIDTTTMESVYPWLPKRITQQTDAIAEIDYTENTYFHNETWGVLRDALVNNQGKTKYCPAMLCQFITTEELTSELLTALQAQDIDKLTVINRWHSKKDYRLYDKLMMNISWENAGYLSMAGENILTNENGYDAKDGLPNFVYEKGIDVCVTCPECECRTSAEDLYINKVCKDCASPFIRALKGKLKQGGQ